MAVVELNKDILEWAISRSGRSSEELERSLRQLSAWRSGQQNPTFKQLGKLAKETRTPIGYFFLDTPPEDKLPIRDLRTPASCGVTQPSVDLLDTIYQCQQRQAWYESYAERQGYPPLPFVGSVNLDNLPIDVAEMIRNTIDFQMEERKETRSLDASLGQFIDLVENTGIMVMKSGIVGSNTRRKLDPGEFRGFALSHHLAPLIFINSADSKSAQMFTLAHELAHIWLGESALSNATVAFGEGATIERWCNHVAAELLLPIDFVPKEIIGGKLPDTVAELSKKFKVSSLVVLRRLYDSGAIKKEQFRPAYRAEVDRAKQKARKTKGGGDFYLTKAVRLGRIFGRAITSDTLEGKTTYTEACRLMSIKDVNVLDRLAKRFEVID